MVIICSAPGCSTKKENLNHKSSLLFHKFPLKRPEVVAKWIKAMKRPNFKPISTSYLCSLHFTNSDYDTKAVNSGKQLKPNAVPSIFEKRRPGRKKKVMNENNTVEEVLKETKSEESTESKESEERNENYLQFEHDHNVESNLAEIIGNRENGTLQVLIVGEDGKITNSEYIFKKEMASDEEFKLESDALSMAYQTDNENMADCKETISNKYSGGNSSNNVKLYANQCLKYREKVKTLGHALGLATKKIRILQMRLKNKSKKNKQLRLLLKLLILKRGKGEKNLKQLFDEYKSFSYDQQVKIKIEQENFYVDN